MLIQELTCDYLGCYSGRCKLGEQEGWWAITKTSTPFKLITIQAERLSAKSIPPADALIACANHGDDVMKQIIKYSDFQEPQLDRYEPVTAPETDDDKPI